VKYWVVLGMVLGMVGCGRLHHMPRKFRCNENVFCWCAMDKGRQRPLYCTNGVHLAGVPNE
jgi:hypothetical protein